MLKDCVPQEKYREECQVCRRAKKHCLCKYIKPFNNAFHFVILMSVAEAKYQRTGSGRLAHLTLRNSEIIVGNDFTEDRRVNEIINDEKTDKLILYPGKNAVTFAQLEADRAGDKCGTAISYPEKPLYVFVIDGTWRGAKSMMFHSENLKKIPCISFEHSYLSNFRIKRQPEEHCVSTIEAIYYLLKEAEEHGFLPPGNEKEALPDIFNRMVEIQLEYSRQHRHRREDNPKVREKLLKKEALRRQKLLETAKQAGSR